MSLFMLQTGPSMEPGRRNSLRTQELQQGFRSQHLSRPSLGGGGSASGSQAAGYNRGEGGWARGQEVRGVNSQGRPVERPCLDPACPAPCRALRGRPAAPRLLPAAARARPAGGPSRAPRPRRLRVPQVHTGLGLAWQPGNLFQSRLPSPRTPRPPPEPGPEPIP